MAYARKEEKFWTDPELRKINYTARYLFDWFFTNPQRHFSGVYFYEKSIISPQTGIPLKLIDNSIRELEDHGFIRVCKEHSVVFVCNMLKHQTMENPLSPTQTVGIKNHLKSLHCKCFESEFNNKYKHLFSDKDIPWKKNREPMDTPMDTPIQTPMHTNSHSHSQYKRKTLVSPGRGNGVDQDFEIWWKEYPGRRKTGKPVCLAKWKHLHKIGTLPPLDEMIATLKAQKQSLDWIKDAGEFIPGPLPYLNQSKFLDESIQPSREPPQTIRNPACPRCHGKGIYQSGTMPDGSPAFLNCKCEITDG